MTYEELLVHKPQFLEFHFTDEDLNEKYPGHDYDMPLVVHAPEFWERTLVDLCALDEKQRNGSISLDTEVHRPDPGNGAPF